jgi:branched-chain amino acid transport system permease protein
MDVLLLGVVIGIGDALLAVGLVLIYKANRVINLAYGEIGAFAVAMMVAMVRVGHINYWLSLLASLAATGVLSAFIERTILRRLFKSPRLLLMLATIGVAQIVMVLRFILPKPKNLEGDPILAAGGSQFPVPFHFETVHIFGFSLSPGDAIALVIGPIVAIAVFAFMRWSSYGIALRAAAENGQRARLLGIPVRRVSTLAWVVAGVLSAIASILLAPVIGFSAGQAVGMGGLLRGLAAATVAGMESVPIAFGVGLLIGVVDQGVYFLTGLPGLTDVILFAVILITLLSRRRSRPRAGATTESSWEAAEPVRHLPLEVLRHAAWRNLSRGTTIAGVALLIASPWIFGVSVTFLLATMFLSAAVAVSMTVLTGWAGQISLGQWALAGVGGVYGSHLVGVFHLNFWLALVLATLLGALIALAIGLPALRLEGSSLAVVTLGFAVLSSTWLFQQSWFTGGRTFEAPIYVTANRTYYLLSAGFLSAVVALTRAMQRSRIGRVIIASRDNPAQAASMGVSLVGAKLTAFAISGTIAAAAGYLYAAGVTVADSSTFQPVTSLSMVAAVVIGGMGSIAGAIIGTVYVLGIPYFAGAISPWIGLLATGFGLLGLLLFLPGGLARIVYSARDMLARAVTGIDPRPAVIPTSVPVPAPEPAEVP